MTGKGRDGGRGIYEHYTAPVWMGSDIVPEAIEGTLRRIVEEAGFYLYGSDSDWTGRSFDGIVASVRFAVRFAEDLDPFFPNGFGEEGLVTDDMVLDWINDDRDFNALQDMSGLQIDKALDSEDKEVRIGRYKPATRRIWTYTVDITW